MTFNTISTVCMLSKNVGAAFPHSMGYRPEAARRHSPPRRHGSPEFNCALKPPLEHTQYTVKSEPLAQITSNLLHLEILVIKLHF